jgi:hypothetical protein
MAALPENSVARLPVVCPHCSANVVSTMGAKRSGGTPLTSLANCTSTVNRP